MFHYLYFVQIISDLKNFFSLNTQSIFCATKAEFLLITKFSLFTFNWIKLNKNIDYLKTKDTFKLN